MILIELRFLLPVKSKHLKILCAVNLKINRKKIFINVIWEFWYRYWKTKTIFRLYGYIRIRKLDQEDQEDIWIIMSF